jgi:hypothetical protein
MSIKSNAVGKCRVERIRLCSFVWSFQNGKRVARSGNAHEYLERWWTSLARSEEKSSWRGLHVLLIGPRAKGVPVVGPAKRRDILSGFFLKTRKMRAETFMRDGAGEALYGMRNLLGL